MGADPDLHPEVTPRLVFPMISAFSVFQNVLFAWLQAMKLKLGVCLGVCGGWGRKDRQEGWGPGLTCPGLSLQEQFMFWDLGSGQGTVPASCRVAGCGELRLQQVFWGMRHEVRSSQGWGNATSRWFIYIYYVPDQLLKHQSKLKSFRGKSLSGCLLHR